MAVFKRRWFMWDFARQRRFDRQEFTLVAEKLSSLGYNGIGLYLEGAFELSCLGGGILREGVMTKDDAVWAKEKCDSLGIKLFPLTNVVGHMEHFLRQERFYGLASKENIGYAIDFTKPASKEFVLKIVDEYIDAFKTDYIHIGGDEVNLTDETRPVYAEFLAELCDDLLKRGIKPAIWNDLLWAHRELCAPFSREVDIFDWNYYAHRKESIEFFKNEGFNVIACPSDNSWQAFTGHQFVRHWRDDEDQTPVTPDEIEAFLSDEAKAGDPENLQGMVTLWESTMGRDIWGQWSALARAGLYMSGKLDKEDADEQIEKAVFGRITPCTEIVHIIQNEIHSCFEWPGFAAQLRQSLFIKDMYFSGAIIDDDGRDKTALTKEPIERIEKLLEGWIPENEFERRCRINFVSIVGMMKAAFALRAAFFAQKELYTAAAKKQFSEPETAGKLILRFAEGFSFAAEQMKSYRKDLEALISCTAHTATDLIKLDNTIGYTEKMASTIQGFAEAPSFEGIPLPAINYVLEWVLDDVVIEK